MLFHLLNSKLRNVFDKIAKFYVSIVINHTSLLVFLYFLFSIILSFGLLQLKFNVDTDKITFVHKSKSLESADYLNQTFVFDEHNRYFLNKLLDLGHYVEIIVLVRDIGSGERKSNDDLIKPQFNIINQTIIDEINQLFDSIVTLSFNDTDFNGSYRTYTYLNDLCARRLNKCSIENGLFRNELVQRDLLEHKVYYQDKDPLSSYGNANVVDGFSVKVLFGKYTLEKPIDDDEDPYMGKKYAIYHAGAVRIRFDLLATTEKEKYLSLKFMHVFADHLLKVQENDLYKSLNFSFYTSHTLQAELEKYSQNDIHTIIKSFFVFWLLLFFSIWFNFSCDKQANNSNCCNFLFEFICFKVKWNSLFERIKSKSNRLMINSGSFMPFTILIKFILSITSSFGAISLLSVELNPFALTIIFILMINGCHQSFILYSNLKNTKPFSNEEQQTGIKSSNIYEQEASLDNNDTDIENVSLNKQKINELNIENSMNIVAQQNLIPIALSILASILTYAVISLTNAFDSIKTFCWLTMIAILLDFIGQLTFYFPCLYLHLHRISQHRNCIFFCYKHKSDSVKEEFSLAEKRIKTKTLNDNELKENSATNWNSESIKADKKCKLLNILFYSRIKYIIFVLFIAYLIFNSVIFIKYYKADIPITDLIPEKSYLRKHMVNHQQLFELGPIIMIVFKKPMKYWEEEVFNTIRSFLDDAKKLDEMNRQFELNWLQISYMNAIKSAEFYDECQEGPFNFTCFYNSVKNVLVNDIYKDDVNYVNENSTFSIETSRIFLELKNFFGSVKEVNLMHQLEHLANERFNKHGQSVLIYSVVYPFLEQIEELTPSLISIFLLNIECVLFVCIVFLIDLKSVLILLILLISFILSVLSNIFLLGYTLNIVTLMHLIIIPSVVCEFFISNTYLYLYSTRRLIKKNRNENNATFKLLANNSNNTTNESARTDASSRLFEFFKQIESQSKQRLEKLNYCFYKTTKQTSFYLLFVLLLSLLVMNSCCTYSFRGLALILISSSLNLFIHIYLFHSALLVLFGTTWPYKEQSFN